MLQPAEKILPILDRLLAPPAPGQTGAWIKAAHKTLELARERISADSAWSSIGEELARKALTATHDAASRHAEGQEGWDLNATIAAVASVYDTVSGLIDKETLDTINSVLRDLRS